MGITTGGEASIKFLEKRSNLETRIKEKHKREVEQIPYNALNKVLEEITLPRCLVDLSYLFLLKRVGKNLFFDARNLGNYYKTQRTLTLPLTEPLHVTEYTLEESDIQEILNFADNYINQDVIHLPKDYFFIRFTEQKVWNAKFRDAGWVGKLEKDESLEEAAKRVFEENRSMTANLVYDNIALYDWESNRYLVKGYKCGRTSRIHPLYLKDVEIRLELLGEGLAA